MRLFLPTLLAAIFLLTPLVQATGAEGIFAVTTSPRLLPIVRAVGGERVEVKSVVPAGADPHHYEPSEAELLDVISEADLIVMTGPSHLAVEERVKALAERGLIAAEIIDYEDYVAAGLRILDNPKTGNPNPHGYHFSLRGIRAIATACARALSSIDPEGSSYYEERLEAFLGQLDSIAESIKALKVGGVRVILLSPALQYISQDLGLRVVDVVLPELDVEPTEKDVSRVVEVLSSGEAELLLLSDFEAARQSKFLSALKERGVKYLVVPVLELVEAPQTIPLATASAIKLSEASNLEAGERGLDLVTISSIAANVILLVLVLLLMWRVKMGGG